MEKDWIGNNKTTYSILGASNHSEKDREEDDFYATSPLSIEAFLANYRGKLNHKIWEPSCGLGHISETLKGHGYDVLSTDLKDRGYGIGNIDFFKTKPDDKFLTDWSKGEPFDIFTNPPYKYVLDYTLHALDMIPENGKLIMFLKTTFLETSKRKQFIFDVNPPVEMYQYSVRQGCAKNGDFVKDFGSIEKANGAVAYAMFVWNKHNDEKNSRIYWI